MCSCNYPVATTTHSFFCFTESHSSSLAHSFRVGKASSCSVHDRLGEFITRGFTEVPVLQMKQLSCI